MIHRIQQLLFILSAASFALPSGAQGVLVDHTFLGSKTRLELVPIVLLYVDYDIHMYRIRYKTLDANMDPDTASGLLVLPQVPAGTKLPLVVYAHGTTTGPEDVPSRLRGGYEIALGYAGFGFATIAPDYIGLGDSDGFHPYLHAGTEASASMDMILAAHEFMEYVDPADLHPQYLFLSGYSQGGHASMALHKLIDEAWSFMFPVTAATHMSGPYSISEVMKERILSNEPYGFPSYIAYIFLGYNEAYDLYPDIGQVFKEPYSTSVMDFYEENINFTQLNNQLIAALTAGGGQTVVKRMLHDSIVEILESNMDHPLSAALSENDTYNWAPLGPTRLYYCGGDQQVPFRNSIIADSVMNALGAEDVMRVSIHPTFDHGPCVFPSVVSSKNFFQSFLMTSALNEQNRLFKELKICPNPSSTEVMIDWPEAGDGYRIQISDMKGNAVRELQSKGSVIQIGDLPAGIYTIVCTSGKEVRISRFIRQ